MKNKYLLFLLLSIFIGLVTVRAYSVSDFVNVANNGDSTKALIEQLKNEGCEPVINATSSGNGVDIYYKMVCQEEKEEVINGKKEKVKKEVYNLEGNIVYTMGANNILESSKERTEKEAKADPFYDRILRLTPYWGTEMSTKYAEVSKYMKKNHKGELLSTYAKIFDSCYMEEMGVCYSFVTGMNYGTYIGKVTMDDSGANYALKYLKKEQRELNTKSMMLKGLIVAGVLVVLIIICKSMAPNPLRKRCKY